MPLYEYKCQKCDHIFDRIVSSSTPDGDIACKKCGEFECKRKLSTFSFGSRSSSGDFKPAPAGGGGCGSCHSHHCGSCHH